MTAIFTRATVPDHLTQKWLQHLRDFDTANPGCHFEVWVDTPNISMNDVIKLVQVEPGLDFTKIFERKRSKP
jgi:hypothetical protein